MKFSAATIFASAVYATKALAATPVKLHIESEDTGVNHHGIDAKHGGAGVDFVYVSDQTSTQTLNFDGTSNTLSMKAGHYDYSFYIAGGFVQLGVAQDPAKVIFDDSGYLTINGSADGFFGCQGVNEPYDYSKTQHALMYKPEDSSNCIALKLKAE